MVSKGAEEIILSSNVILSAIALDSSAYPITNESGIIRYSFSEEGTSSFRGIEYPVTSWTDFEKGEARAILSRISEIANLTFVENELNYDINFRVSEDLGGPGGLAGGNTLTVRRAGNGIYTETGLPIDFKSPFSHEVAHILGLGHPFDNTFNTSILPGVLETEDQGLFGFNSNYYTVMSYTYGDISNYLLPSNNEYPHGNTYALESFGTLDIAALQALYGTNKEHASGNNNYLVRNEVYTIWDSDGHDSIDFSSVSTNSLIDLRAATLDFEEGGAGRASIFDTSGARSGAYLISYGVSIEDGFTGSGDDYLFGNSIDNILISGSGNDTVFGFEGNDALDGGLGNDTLDGGSGNDTLNGGEGRDTVIFNTNYEEITIHRSVNGSINVISDSYGSDTIENVERIKTLNGSLVFDITGDNVEYVYRIYDAAFGRTPDEIGLVFWNDQINEGNVDQASLASLFVDSLEFETLFPSSSNEIFIEALYQNALRRTPDQEGQEFWTDVFTTGELTRTDMLVVFADSPENIMRNADNYDDGVWVI